MTGVKEKICTQCGKTKPFSEFYKDKRVKSGLRAVCKHCDDKRCLEWREKHKGKISERNKKYKAENKNKILEHKKKYREKNKSDPQYRLRHGIRANISIALKGNKKGRHWETLVGYTLSDLKKHLEKQFEDGMTWENYGEWHVDHIIPVSVHNFKKPEDEDFKRCFALKNLQPLWAKDNISKSDKLDRPFQPSLCFG
jgi:hypothetical protein